MNGENKSLIALEALNESLDKYEKESGFHENNEINKIVNFSFRELNKLTPEECVNYSVLLAQFNIYLQRQINKEHSKILWLEERIKKIIVARLNQQKAYSFEERKIMAIREDGVASELEDNKIRIQLKLTRLNYLTDKIKNLSDRLMDMAKIGRRT